MTTTADLVLRAARVTPGGVHSNVRLPVAGVFFSHGKGGRVWDETGKDYVDFLLGQGPQFLGHAPSGVNSAVAESASRGMVFGAQTRLEVDAAEAFLSTSTWAGSVRFGVSGTEVVQAALRLARAYTGKQRIVRFEGHYHGWLDDMLVEVDGQGGVSRGSRGQVESRLDDLVFLEWNDLAALGKCLEEQSDEIAAVIMEPMMCNQGAIVPSPGYLEGVRQLCDRHGVLLIFDEVITGFRLALGGAAERFGVRPDLATYGKALAGGWPVAALAGRSEVMALFAGGVNHSGTFNASMMASGAVVSTISRLMTPCIYEDVSEIGDRLRSGLLDVIEARSAPLLMQGEPMAFHMSIPREGTRREVRNYRELVQRDLRLYAAFAEHLTSHGLWVAPRGIWYVSVAHTESDVDEAVERFDRAVASFDWEGRS